MTEQFTNNLERLSACQAAMDWIMPYESPQRAWSKCNRGDWMLWYLSRTCGPVNSDSHRLLTACKCVCARLVLHFFEDKHPGDLRPRRALEAAEAYAGEQPVDTTAATATYAAVDAAAATAATAAYAAYADAAAAAAAYAAAAVAYAAVAYAAATYAAAAVAYATTIAAAVDARAAMLLKCADEIRKIVIEIPIEG